ncbi:MAG: hypothetical protein ACRC4O_01865, partial [Giesbergeria sp.]
ARSWPMRSVGAVGARFLGLDATHFAQRSDVAAQVCALPQASRWSDALFVMGLKARLGKRHVCRILMR